MRGNALPFQDTSKVRLILGTSPEEARSARASPPLLTTVSFPPDRAVWLRNQLRQQKGRSRRQTSDHYRLQSAAHRPRSRVTPFQIAENT